MPNLLKAAMLDTIQSLHLRGWSKRRIARELGIDRETVARHLGQVQAGSKPAIAPPGSTPPDDGLKPAIAPPGSTTSPGPTTETVADAGQRVGRASECEPWRQAIHDKIDLGLTAQRILPGPDQRARLRRQLLQRPTLRASARSRSRNCPSADWNAAPARKHRSTSAEAPSSKTAKGRVAGRTSFASS